MAKKTLPWTPYENDEQYLHDVIAQLKVGLCRCWCPPVAETDPLGAEIDGAFESMAEIAPQDAHDPATSARLDQLGSAISERIAGRIGATEQAGSWRPSALLLRERFGLDDDDMNLVCLLFARQIDRSMRSVIGEFHNYCGAVKVWTLIRALGATSQCEVHRLWQRLQADAPLMRHRILIQAEREFDLVRGDLGPVMDQKIYLSEHINNFLWGVRDICQGLKYCCELLAPCWDQRAQFLSPTIVGSMDRLIDRYTAEIMPAGEHWYDSVSKNGLLFCLVGPPGSGRRRLAESIAHRMGKALIVFDCEVFLADGQKSELALERLLRDATLLDAIPFLRNIDAWTTETSTAHLVFGLRSVLTTYPGVAIIGSEKATAIDSEVASKIAYRVSLDIPAIPIREAIWAEAMKTHRAHLDDDVDVRQLSRYHPFMVESIHRAIDAAIDMRIIAGDARRIDQDDLIEACRHQMNKKMAYMASQVKSRPGWDALVLPDDKKEVLREIVAYGQYKLAAYEDWGFSQRIALGKGLGCLFYGEPGTGKTMAAGIIARELNKEIYKVNIAQILSKWIGETEKNLDKVFREAQESSAIILFDEADALFGKRHGDIKSATDRYANMEVNYLLSKLEEFEGIVILTTNLKSVMDKAFMRRLHFRIYFPFPDDAERARLWQSMIPVTAPTREPMEWDYLAHKYFRLPGGHIKNAVMRGAVMALQDDASIDTLYLDLAAEKECRETGSLWKVEMNLLEYLGDELFDRIYDQNSRSNQVRERVAANDIR